MGADAREASGAALMMHAILHGKVPSSITHSEDVVTATVFGALRYVGFERGLGPWLSLARRVDGVALAVTGAWDVRFWPSLSHGNAVVEPDVLLTPTTKGLPTLLVECKLWSGPSGNPTPKEDAVVRGQLGRQWLALRSHLHAIGATQAGEPLTDGLIVYVTPDPVMPRATLDAMVSEIESKTAHRGLGERLYWLSWRSLHGLLGPPGDDLEGRVVADLRAFLARYDFVACGPVRAPTAAVVRWSFGRESRTAPSEP